MIDRPDRRAFVIAALAAAGVANLGGALAQTIKSAEDLKPGPAAEALRNGKIDAFFIVAGYPTGSVVELASATPI